MQKHQVNQGETLQLMQPLHRENGSSLLVAEQLCREAESQVFYVLFALSAGIISLISLDRAYILRRDSSY